MAFPIAIFCFVSNTKGNNEMEIELSAIEIESQFLIKMSWNGSGKNA